MLLRSPTFNRCVGCAARSGAGGGQTTTRTMAMHGADHGFTPVLGVGEQVLIGVVGAGNDATSSLASGPPSPGWPFLTPILRAAGSDKKPGQPCDAAGAGRNLVTAPDPIGGPLVLRHASKRSSGTWGPDDYDVIDSRGRDIGRTSKPRAGVPPDHPWEWAITGRYSCRPSVMASAPAWTRPRPSSPRRGARGWRTLGVKPAFPNAARGPERRPVVRSRARPLPTTAISARRKFRGRAL